MDKPLNVLHVIGGGEFGGAEQHILSLLDAFAHHPVKAEVVTFYDSVFSQKLRDRGFRVTVIQPYGRFDFRLYTALKRQFQKKQPDLIHSHGVRANFFARLAGKKAGVKGIVTTVHSILRHDYPQPWLYRIAHLMESGTAGKTDRFIAVSQTVKTDLIEKGIEKRHIALIRNGIDVDRFQPHQEHTDRSLRLRREWGIPETAIVVGTTARLVPVKGLNHLLEGFAMALRQDPSQRDTLYLLIVGDGPERTALQTLARTYGIHNHTVFAGFRTDIRDCLNAIDLYMNTSLSEGLPISLMEAMAAEKPVIVTEVGGMKELLTHEKTGLFIPSGASDPVARSILELIHHPALKRELAENARTLIETDYSHRVMAQKHIELYQNLVQGHFDDGS